VVSNTTSRIQKWLYKNEKHYGLKEVYLSSFFLKVLHSLCCFTTKCRAYPNQNEFLSIAPWWVYSVLHPLNSFQNYIFVKNSVVLTKNAKNGNDKETFINKLDNNLFAKNWLGNYIILYYIILFGR
jgi:hypothetical protein